MAERNLCTNYEVIIVGSGIAGLLLALELDQKGMRTALICKGRLVDSNTSWAQGGVAICTGANRADDPELHLQDTIKAGAGLCDEKIARTIINGGVELFEKLESLGLRFDRKDGTIELAREGGHSQARVVHSQDASGKAISKTLVAAIGRSKRLSIYEHMFACGLITRAGRCIGLRVLKDNQLIEVLAPRVVLASGGLGQVYERSTNPSIATGDGIAMAYRAGAQLVDMEFVQFHPTALYLKGAPASLISEAVRGQGAQLLDSNGERFAFRFHKDGELATRDVVSRAIATVMQEQESQCVWLDMRPIGAATIIEKYPNIIAACRNWGIDPLERPIPVSPAAHYFMGGIYTDSYGRSSLPGLYAIGECAATGLHGANRLASNSLLEGGVMALRAARVILAEKSEEVNRSGSLLKRENLQILRTDLGTTKESLIMTSGISTEETVDLFRKKMFMHVGLVRNGRALSELVLEQFASQEQIVGCSERAIEAANIGLLGMLIARAAMARCESRGAHWRMDYPHRDDAKFLGHYFMSNDRCGFRTIAPDRISVTLLPVRASTMAADA